MSRRSRKQRSQQAHKSNEGGGDSPTARKKQNQASAGRRWVAVIVVSILVVAGGVVGWRQFRPAPRVVIPNDLEELEPQFKAYVRAFIENVRQSPQDAMAHAELGLVYEANQRWTDARDCFSNSIELNPNEPLAHYHLALVLLNSGQIDEAVEVLRRVTGKFSNFAVGLNRLGQTLLETGAVEEATEAYTKAVALVPHDVAPLVGLADCKIRSGEHAEAIELLEKALEIKPREKMAHYLLGLAYRATGRLEEAERELAGGSGTTAVVMLDAWTRRMTTHAKGLGRQMRRALAFLRSGRAEDAIGMFNVALEWHPDNVELLNNTAIAYMAAKQPNEARRVLRKAEQIDDERFETLVNFAKCQAQRGRHDLALEYAERAVAAAPKQAKAHRSRGRSLVNLLRMDEAVAAFKRAIELDPSEHGAVLELANAYVRMNLHAQAAEQLRKFTKLSPFHLSSHIRLGDSCLAVGDLECAQKALADARRIKADSPAVSALADRISQHANQ